MQIFSLDHGRPTCWLHSARASAGSHWSPKLLSPSVILFHCFNIAATYWAVKKKKEKESASLNKEIRRLWPTKTDRIVRVALTFLIAGTKCQQKRLRGERNYFSSHFRGGEGMTLFRVDKMASNQSVGDMRSLVHVSVQQEVESTGKSWAQPQPSTLLLRLYLCQLYPISQRCPNLPKQRHLLEVKCPNTWVYKECSTLRSLTC